MNKQTECIHATQPKKEGATDVCNHMDGPQNVILSERIRAAKAVYYMTPLMRTSTVDKTNP